MTDPPDPPAWLTALVAALGEGQDPATVPAWTCRVRGELDRLAGRVPFQVVYDWHAHLFGPTRNGTGEPHRLVGGLHQRVQAGERIEAAEWASALRPALRELYRAAYPYTAAHAVAYANAHAYATANGYSADEVVEYAGFYADLSTNANVTAQADANAIANANALGAALALADERAYAETYPAALVRAHALAEANRTDAPGAQQALRAAYGRLADALADCLSRVAV
ncbi:hypothetical protein GCM10027290_00880 [Micromonospora sonneratiae]|uniref:SpcZ n=1 Tax=Micromonospora sonneratiae TaxID=1184706 RepID=A0ABW3Y6A2_9ACTN